MQVMSVTGPVQPADLGVVLPHEHVFTNLVREYRGTGLLNDEHLARRELELLRAAGGGTLVDLTLDEIGRDPAALRRVAEATGVTIVMGCGHYRDPYLDRGWFDRHAVDAIAEEMVRDIEEGAHGTGIRAGIIGEIGADQRYISAAEERSFRAAARAHRRTGLTISTHAARWPVGTEQLRLLAEEGVDPRRVIIGHADTVPLPEYHLALARQGCYVSFDSIGTGTPYDLGRVADYVLALVRAGLGARVLLSHDIFLRGQLHADGGCGYGYLLTDFLPLLADAGLDPAEARSLVTANPQAALTGESPG
ncbi:MAG: phosphotriesterase [Streptosporangiaceae bacterium]|jgi:phosphotriesterase-related protein